MRLLDAPHAQDFITHLETFEGRTNYLDLGTGGLPTVGVGCAVPYSGVSESLEWQGGMGAVGIAAAEWNVIKNATPGLSAKAYAHLTTLRLPDAEIDRLRDARIDTMETDLINAISGVSAFPMPVRQALCDMAFNLGSGRLHSEYFSQHSKFGLAIYAGDWQTAAQESARRGIAQARNDYVRDLIMAGL